MAYTLQQLVQDCTALNDDGLGGNPKRWPDSLRLRYAQEGLEKLRRERPDACMKHFATDFRVLALTDNFPLDTSFVKAVIEFVQAQCLLHNNDVGAEGSSASVHLGLAAGDLNG
jgi:hypothetical protein